MIAAAFAGNKVASGMTISLGKNPKSALLVTRSPYCTEWYFVSPPKFKFYPVDSPQHREYVANAKIICDQMIAGGSIVVSNPRTGFKLSGSEF
jgi:hypothetical protein